MGNITGSPGPETIPRRAGVSSFGFGGVNAHIVIEEYIPEGQGSVPITPEKPAVPGHAIIVLSAKNEERLKEQALQLSRQQSKSGLSWPWRIWPIPCRWDGKPWKNG